MADTIIPAARTATLIVTLNGVSKDIIVSDKMIVPEQPS